MYASPPGSGVPPPGWPGAEPIGPGQRPPARPSGWWFVVAGVLAFVGVAVGVVVIVRGAVGFADRVEDFDRSAMPATLEVEIDDPGGYSIYHEYDGFSSVEYRERPDVEVTDPSGDDVVLRRYSSTVTYDVSGHDGVGVYTFRADEPGTYRVEASMPVSDSDLDVIAVGRGLGSGLAVAIVSGLALIGLGLVGGIVISIVVGVLRSRRRRAAMPPPVIGWGAPGQWGAPAWPPGPGAHGWAPGAGAPGWPPPPVPPAAPPASAHPAPAPHPPPAPAPAGPPVDAPPHDTPWPEPPPADAPPGGRA